MTEANASYLHADARRADRQRAVGGDRRPLLRRVPAQREGAARTCSCRGPMARSSRASSAPPASRPTSASTSTTRERQQRHPILDDHEMWDIFPRPLADAHRAAGVGSAIDPQPRRPALIGAMNVYESTLHDVRRRARSTASRVMEGFSSEEGFPRDVRHHDVRGPRRTSASRASPGRLWLATVPGERPAPPADHRQVRHVAVQRARVVLRRAPVSRACAVAATRTARATHGHQPRHHAGRRDRPDARCTASPPRAIACRRCRPREPEPDRDADGTGATTSSSAWRGTRRSSRASTRSASAATTATTSAGIPTYTIIDPITGASRVSGRST